MPVKTAISLDFVYSVSQKLLKPVYASQDTQVRNTNLLMFSPWDFSYLKVLPVVEAQTNNVWVENDVNWPETLEHSPLHLALPFQRNNEKPQNKQPQRAYTHFTLKHRLALWAKALEPETAFGQTLPKYAKTQSSDVNINSKARPFNLLADRYCFLPLKQVIGETQLRVINQNLMNLMPKKHFDDLIKKALRLFPFLKFNRVAARLIAAVFMLLKYKEAYPLLVFLKFLFQDVHYSKHKPYYRFVNYLVLFIIGPRLHSFQCLGAQITFKGKLAVGGNSRKAVQRTSTGMISSSSKFIKISRHSSAIRTKTGAVGFSVLVAW